MPSYHKLVRDNIPSIIESNGKIAKTRVLGTEEYQKALQEKLVEETKEYLANPTSLEELADIQDVVLALAESMGYESEDLERTRREKRDSKWSFRKTHFSRISRRKRRKRGLFNLTFFRLMGEAFWPSPLLFMNFADCW